MPRHDDRQRREIDEEIQSHLRARVDHLIAHGLSPDDAHREALRRFGDVEAGRAALVAAADARRRRRQLTHQVDALLQDVRYVIRSLRRHPVFTAGVIFTFALGLGINTAIFRVADTVLFRAPAGVRDPQTVRQIETAQSLAPGGEPMRASSFSWRDARQVIQSGAFATVSAGTLPRQLALADGRAVSVSYVDQAFLPLLGVSPVAGRLFTAEEGRPGSQQAVALVSESLWQRTLGAPALEPAPMITIGVRAYRVVGILPAVFSGIDLDPTDIWLPLGTGEFGRGFSNGTTMAWYETEMSRPLRLIGRLAPGATDTVAADRVTASLAATTSPDVPMRRAQLRPIVPVGRAAAMEASNRIIFRLLGVASIVLVIAAANAANLLLARGIRRRPELAIRAAIGASRTRLARLLVVESVVLAMAGAAAASLAGGWTAETLRRLLFPDGRWTAAGFDVRSLLFTGGLALVAGLAAGFAPMAQATGINLIPTLQDGRTQSGARSNRTRVSLLVAQTALTLALLVLSGLLVRSLLRLGQVPLGFDPRGLVTLSLTNTSPEALFGAPDPPTMEAFLARLQIGALGRRAALTSSQPFASTSRIGFSVPGSSFRPASDDEQAQTVSVEPHYFAVMGTRLISGRGFADADSTGPPVTIVNQSMARAYWGAALPSGACVMTRMGRPCARVIGIVEDVRESPAQEPILRFYLPNWDRPPSAVVIRTSGADAPNLLRQIQAATPPGFRLIAEVTQERIDRALRPWRTAAALFFTLGVVALALACGGIYSVMAFIAADRTRELGIRIALGATRGAVLRMILGDSLRLVLMAGVTGLAIAAAAGRLLGALLFDVSPFDPAVYGVAFACVTVAALAATIVPASRASRTDAIEALRQL